MVIVMMVVMMMMMVRTPRTSCSSTTPTCSGWTRSYTYAHTTIRIGIGIDILIGSADIHTRNGRSKRMHH